MLRILTAGDKALGLGDAFILAPTLLELAKTYEVRHITTAQSYNILKHLHDGKQLLIFNMDTQGQYYKNDSYQSLNLTYWEVRNTLRQFGGNAINITREIAGLPRITNEPLPTIPIPEHIDLAVKDLFSNFKRPIVVTQPLVT